MTMASRMPAPSQIRVRVTLEALTAEGPWGDAAAASGAADAGTEAADTGSRRYISVTRYGDCPVDN